MTDPNIFMLLSSHLFGTYRGNSYSAIRNTLPSVAYLGGDPSWQFEATKVSGISHMISYN